LLIALCLLVSVTSHAAEPASRKVLFFDLWKLDSWNNLVLRQGEPEWVQACQYRDPTFPERGVYFPSVWIDPETDRWKMIYSVKWSPMTLMAATSGDGIHWKPLPAEEVDPGGEKLAPNHLLTVPGGSGGGVYRDPMQTDGYAYRIFGRLRGEPVYQRALADPDHRWHDIAQAEGLKPYMDEGITVVSRDGANWEVKTGDQWNWQDDDWYPEPPVFAFWNARQKRHVMAARPGWGDRRQCLRSSADLRSWTPPQLQFQPDPLDTTGPIGMYGLPVAPVGNGAGYVGLLWIFHNSSSEPVGSFNQFYGTMDAQLVYSYDGVRFVRGMRTPFLRRNPIPQPGCTQIRPCSIVETDEHIWIYSEGHRGAHGRERSQRKRLDEPLASLLLHRLRTDGWMYVTSAGDWATLQTKPFALRSPQIHLNAAADYGELQYQLTDVDSQPLEGFTFDDCVPLQNQDALRYRLRWDSDAKLEEVVDRPLRLEIKLRQANLYAIEMAHHFLDAHDQWLLKDGQPIPDQPRFDF
jgi:hypothetical protein